MTQYFASTKDGVAVIKFISSVIDEKRLIFIFINLRKNYGYRGTAVAARSMMAAVQAVLWGTCNMGNKAT